MFSKKKILANSKLLIRFDDGTVSLEDVICSDLDTIETKYRLLNVSETDKYVCVDGFLVYTCNLDFSAKVESERLKSLRRSVAISNLFTVSSSSQKGFDLFKLLPYLIILVLILFK